MDIMQYVRIPFQVDAVQVTAENLAEVAEWCNGEVARVYPGQGKSDYVAFKKTRTFSSNDANERVTHTNERLIKAFVGEWIVKKGDSFKVFPDWAFKNNFEEDHSLTPGEALIAADVIGETLIRQTFDKDDFDTFDGLGEVHPELPVTDVPETNV